MNLTNLVAFAVLVLASCAGRRSQESALLPPVRDAWPSVRVDFDHGVEVGVAAGTLTPPAASDLTRTADLLGDALSAGDLVGVRLTPWQPLEDWTEEGIADKLRAGLIGPGVAESLRERLRNFAEALSRLQEQR